MNPQGGGKPKGPSSGGKPKGGVLGPGGKGSTEYRNVFAQQYRRGAYGPASGSGGAAGAADSHHASPVRSAPVSPRHFIDDRGRSLSFSEEDVRESSWSDTPAIRESAAERPAMMVRYTAARGLPGTPGAGRAGFGKGPFGKGAFGKGGFGKGGGFRGPPGKGAWGDKWNKGWHRPSTKQKGRTKDFFSHPRKGSILAAHSEEGRRSSKEDDVELDMVEQSMEKCPFLLILSPVVVLLLMSVLSPMLGLRKSFTDGAKGTDAIQTEGVRRGSVDASGTVGRRSSVRRSSVGSENSRGSARSPDSQKSKKRRERRASVVPPEEIAAAAASFLDVSKSSPDGEGNVAKSFLDVSQEAWGHDGHDAGQSFLAEVTDGGDVVFPKWPSEEKVDEDETRGLSTDVD